MKTLFLVFLTTCCLTLTAQAQTPEQKTPPPSSAPQQMSPALQEAAKLNTEVLSLFGQKKFAEALPLAQRIVAIREKELGKFHLSVAQAYWNLANIQSLLGNNKQAEDSFENAFDAYEKNHPLAAGDEKTFVQLLEKVAYNQALKSEFDKAEKKFQRAVEIGERINGRESPETANSLASLAALYSVKNDHGKAAPLLLRVLDIKARKNGIDSDETGIAFQDVSCVLTKLGREDELTEVENKYGLQQSPVVPTAPVKTGVVNGKALKLALPVYPAEAKEKRLSGTVNVKVMINEEGKVIRACAVTGAKEFHRATEFAAYSSKFTPTTVQGKPVRVTGTIVYNFVAR